MVAKKDCSFNCPQWSLTSLQFCCCCHNDVAGTALNISLQPKRSATIVLVTADLLVQSCQKVIASGINLLCDRDFSKDLLHSARNVM